LKYFIIKQKKEKKMKKITVIIFLLGVIGISCKKQYNCECDMTNHATLLNQTSSYNHKVNFTTQKASKKDAKQECDNYEHNWKSASGDGTSNGTYSVNVTGGCNLK
jgi:uncharacterized protein YxeA